MPTHSTVAVILGTLCASFFTSCASVSVKDSSQSTKATARRKPAHIYVVPFSVAHTATKENFARKNKGELKFEERDLLASALVSDLSKNIAPASLTHPNQIPTANAWVVSGQITRAAEGSRILRMGFGLGAGGTKLATRVQVQNSLGQPLLQFDTIGGSGAVPGAATNPIPFSSVPTALLHTNEGVTDDANRTARMITSRIGEYLAQRGWMASNKLQKPKRL